MAVGSVADADDNTLAESRIGHYETELNRPKGPWRDVDQAELTLDRFHWFNAHEPRATPGPAPTAS